MNIRQNIKYKPQRWINFIVVSVLIASLTSCSSSSKSGSKQDHLIPQEGLTVQQIYRQSSSGENNGLYEGEFGSSNDDQSVEAARAQIPAVYPATVQASPFQTPKTQFALMDNPSVPIYVYPHLVKMGNDEVPVDGYATTFFLYSQNHYALPWEHY